MDMRMYWPLRYDQNAHRLSRLILRTPWWESQCADPGEKQGPARDDCPRGEMADTLNGFDVEEANREAHPSIPATRMDHQALDQTFMVLCTGDIGPSCLCGCTIQDWCLANSSLVSMS
jgi:hypothetical protein